MQQETSPENIVVATFYRFVPLAGLPGLRTRLLRAARGRDVRGTILLAEEGVNGTISGARADVDTILEALRAEPGLAQLGVRETIHDAHPFGRFKVRLKQEIVTLGVPGVDPVARTGEHVPPTAWNALIERDEVVLIDTRNRYETHLGSFAGARDPGTESFREFPAWVARNLDPARDREVAMFCTGGIRCEKATAYLLEQGFERVYQLEGGVLAYLEQVSAPESRWRGECFVFDDRATVDQELAAGGHELCPNCRIPILPEDRQRPEYEPNVSCVHCYERTTPRRRAALAERRRQEALARERAGGTSE